MSDLTTRFRFSEHYTTADPKPKPSDIGPYKVAFKVIHRRVTEQEQGAPDREESNNLSIFTERPTVVNATGQVTDSVRRYDRFEFSHSQGKKLVTEKPLEGLTIWYKTRPGVSPLLMTLDEARPLTDVDYQNLAEALFIPDLASILPTKPTRVSDRWLLPKEALKALFGKAPIKAPPVYATLQDVRKSEDGKKTVAQISVAGKAQLPPHGAEYTLNSQLSFSYDTPPSTPPGAEKTGLVEVIGQITDLRLALTTTSYVPNTKKRLLRTLTNELVLQRRPLGAGDKPLTAPATPPAPSQANSWLTYTDPAGRFNFRHPQELETENAPAGDEDSDEVVLADTPPARTPPTVVTLGLVPKSGNPDKDRTLRDPDYYFTVLKDRWTEAGIQPIQGPRGWLPETEWKADVWKVYRIEAALKMGGPENRNESRIFFDQYIVQFAQNECLVISATTPKDPPNPFRAQVEDILKTFKLGTPKKAGGS